MGRRKKSKFMEDDDDSSDSNNSNGEAQEDEFDPNDEDAAADRELFKNPYARQKKRARHEDQELDEGDWGRGQSNGNAKGKGKRTNYTKGQSFVPAGGASSLQSTQPIDNLSTTYTIESELPNNESEEIPMELDSDIDSDDSSEAENDQEATSKEVEEESLASVPGLNQPKNDDLPSFASRGIGMRSGIGGGIGSRGIGSSSVNVGSGIGSSGGGGIGSKGITTASKPLVFASATSASAMPLGGYNSVTNELPTSGTASPMSEAATSRSGLGAGNSSRAGIGGGGIGSQPRQSLADSIRSRLAASNPLPASPAESDTSDSPFNSNPPSPSASTDQTEPLRERRSFLPTSKSTPIATVGKISVKEQQHFKALQAGGDLGFKLLEKMGWTSGTGLGASGQGIVTPIGEGQKMRKKGAGIASGERSAGSLAEAKRMRGEDPDEPDKPKGRPQKEAAPKAVRDVWQQPKKKTPKVKSEYKTYEQIVADVGGEPEGVGLLIDLSGKALSSSALSSLPAFGAGSADPTRLPELRHNLSLLSSTTFASLSSLAREGKSVEERRLYLDHEEGRIRKAVESQEHSINRLESIKKIVEKITEIERETMELLLVVESSGGELDPEMFLKPFVDEFDELYGNYSKEYEEMRLDEVVVGAIAPIIRRLLSNWDPLTSPSYVVSSLKRWKKHFLIDKDVFLSDGQDIDVFGAAHHSNGGSSSKASDRLMTPYESMLWTIWLPKVRSSINNAWSPSNPSAAVNILTAWVPILPLFLRDNTLDQLIMPKVLKAITDWSPSSVKRGGASLHTIVFPWLEHAGERMELILEEAKRKVRSWLKSWKVSDGVPAGMDLWQEAFPSSDWDSLILKHVLPQLGTTLRETFVINPRSQDLKPLEDVMAWSNLIRSSILSQLLETGFFPKWLNALYVWLTSDKPNFDQVAEWYSYWKSYFSDSVLALSGVSRGFRKGLDLMNQAMALGDDAKYRLKRPDTTPKLTSSSHRSSNPRSTHTSSTTITAETSFKSIVEEIAAASNLLFLSTNQVNEKGYAIYKVSKTLSGIGSSGVRVYLDGDVVWIKDGIDWKAVGVDEMVKRALK